MPYSMHYKVTLYAVGMVFLYERHNVSIGKSSLDVACIFPSEWSVPRREKFLVKKPHLRVCSGSEQIRTALIEHRLRTDEGKKEK